MSTIVGTNIEVTNIKFDSDTTSMIISNTGQITAQGEGTATTNLQQGLAKAWLNMDCTGTPAANDSYNIGTITDHGTGDFTQNFTSNMGNTNYAPACIAQDDHASTSNFGGTNGHIYRQSTGLQTSAARIMGGVAGTGSRYDPKVLAFSIHGDLA